MRDQEEIVQRHDPKLSRPRIESAIMVRERGIEGGLAKPFLTADNLAALLQLGFALAQYCCALNPSDRRIARGLSVVARAGALLFAASATSSRELLFVDDRRLELGPFDNVNSISPRAWMQGFYAGMVLRDVYALDLLADVDLDLIRQAPSSTDEFGYLHIAALQAYQRREDDAPERTLAALRATEPEGVSDGLKDWALRIAVPEIELLFRLIDRDSVNIGQAATQALEQHRTYYTRSDAPVLGQLALGPAALAARARDLGLDVAPASDYIPEWLLDSSSSGMST